MSVKLDPAAVTVNECSSVTLNSSMTTGSPPFYYQWYKNEVAIPGATGAAFTTPPLLRADNGTVYKLVVSNLFSSGNDSVVTSVIPDDDPPYPVSALICPSDNKVTVLFNKPLDAASASVTSHYYIGGGATILAAALQPNGKTAVLTVPGILNGSCYILAVNGLADSCPGNLVPPGSTTVIRSIPKASGRQNLVVVEAENFDFNNSPQGATSWLFSNSFAGFSGTGYMAALPDTAVIAGNGPSLSPALYLDYCIEFPTNGTFYFWLRGATGDTNGAGNSVHIALDGANPNSTNNNRIGNDINDWGATCGPPQSWGWVHNSAVTGGPSSVDVPSAGVHTFRIWFREDGVKLDQFVLTTDPAFTLGPCAAPLAATPRAAPQLRIRRDTNGRVALTWDGPDCRLQASSVLGSSPPNWHEVDASSPFTITDPTETTFYRLVFP